jgi:UDP-glucose 4-epimerase
MADALKNINAVVHLAARAHVMRDSASDPLKEYRATNVTGSRNVALAAARQGVRRMIFVSSAKVNGEATNGKPFAEDDPADPQDAYAISKWEAEETLRQLAVETGLEIVIIRPPLVYGPGVRANFLRLMKLVDRALLFPISSTENRRSLVGVSNLADFIVQCIRHNEAVNQTYMVSDGEDVSTRELALRLGSALRREVSFIPISESLLRKAGKLLQRQNEVSRLLDSLSIDSNKARRSLEWLPPVSLDEGLRTTAEWYLERRPARRCEESF